MNRNYEKELFFYQQELVKVMNEKIIVQAMFDDAMLENESIKKELDELKNE